MDKSTDDDDLEDILLLENASSSRKNKHDFPCISSMEKSVMVGKSQVFSKDFQKKSEYQKENMLSECNINDCNNLLSFNKQIISLLLDLKKHITCALEKCETKLTVIESSLDKHVSGDTKALICNAGMPYFKDRNHFFAPNNDDELLKENLKELHLRNLPKVAPWTIKERNALAKAIQNETDVASYETNQSEPLLELDETMETRNRLLSNEHDNQIVPLQEKDFDWFKMSSIRFEDVHSPLDCRVMWNVFLHPRINKNSWTKLEDVKLKEIAKRYKYQNWDRVAAELNTHRSAYQCFIRYNTIRKLPKVKNFIWKHREDDKLLKLVQIFQIGDFIPWGEVASWMQNRTKQQVYFRWTYSLAPYLTKGRFNKSEDNLLKDAVAKYGTNFRKISAALMPNRSTVQLHDRYQTLINNQIKNWNIWSLEEDLKLLDLFDRFGPNWSRISKAFACKTRTKLRHRHTALQKFINKGVSIHDLHTNYSHHRYNEIKQETRNDESDGSNQTDRVDRDPSNKGHKDHDEDIDNELIKYFHTDEEKIEKSLDRRQQPCTSDNLECNVKKLYDILRQLNAELSIPEDAFNNSMLHDKHRQLLCSLKEYTDMKNNKKRQRTVIDKHSLLMFGVNHTPERASNKFPNRTGCIDYRVDTKSRFLVDKTIVCDTPDVVVSHLGGKEKELEFEKVARLLVQSSSSKDKQPVRTVKGEGVYAFPSRMCLDQNYSAANSRDNDNRTSLNCNESTSARANVRGRINRLTTCAQSKNTVRNITLFNTFETIREFTSAPSPMETSKDQYAPAIETTHATLFSFKRLLGLEQSANEEHDNPQKLFRKMSTRCQRSFNLLETRLEQLFKYPIGLSRTTLPEVYVMDTFSYDDVKSKRKAADPPTIPKPCKTRKYQIFNKNKKDDN